MSFGFNPQQGLIIVPTELAGPAGTTLVRLALDTGATSTVVNVAVQVFIGYDPALATDRVQVTTGSTVEFPPRVVRNKVVALGQTRLAFPVLAHTLPPNTTAHLAEKLTLPSCEERVARPESAKGVAVEYYRRKDHALRSLRACHTAQRCAVVLSANINGLLGLDFFRG